MQFRGDGFLPKKMFARKYILQRTIRWFKKYSRNGKVDHYVFLTDSCKKPGWRATGIAKFGSICRIRSPYLEYLKVSITNLAKGQHTVAHTGRVVAHEIGHAMGLYHDFEQQWRNKRWTNCLKENSVMNYGSPKPEKWSPCSRYDWFMHVAKLHSDGMYCLKTREQHGAQKPGDGTWRPKW